MGYILLSVRIFDAITDPAIGFISDRAKTPFGRRRPFIAGGSFFVSLSMYFLFNPPEVSSSYSALWFAACIYALFFFWTLVSVPYESLGPEITFDYHERISLFGVRDGFLIAGTLAAASSPALVEWLFNLSNTAQGERAKYFWIAVIYAPLVICFSWWCVISIKEVPSTRVNRPVRILKRLREMGRNRPFIILLIAYTISAIGNNLPATLILFYVEYVLHSNLADFPGMDFDLTQDREKKGVADVHGHKYGRFFRCFFSWTRRCRDLRGIGVFIRNRFRCHIGDSIRHTGGRHRL
jgi:GPH family glycoside/pentoside/hexuronide:cation symporter